MKTMKDEAQTSDVWDWPDPFTADFIAQPEHIDELKHVNNAVYVQWMEDCAWQHSSALGLGVESFVALDRSMAVLRHEIDYLASAYEDDRVQMGTWLVKTASLLKMDRLFQLIRPADGATLLRARTTFVCVAMSSGKPRRMPEEFVKGYGSAWREIMDG